MHLVRTTSEPLAADVILVVNSGSSSLKFAVYPATADDTVPLISGKVAGIGRQPVLTATGRDGAIDATGSLVDVPKDADHEWIIAELLERLQERFSHLNPIAAGHRVVHGGRDLTDAVIVDRTIRNTLDALIPMAPMHQPHNLAAIDAIEKLAPQLPQVACFDTSFHRTQPRLAQLFALPRPLTDEGIIRYGFHGLSYEYIAAALPKHLGEAANGRVIVAHLGNGASMCAMRERKSMATSMGFTALDGLMMGQRCGQLDAGVVLHLIEQRGFSASDVRDLLYAQSGLYGVSGISNNMQVLEASNDPRAHESIDLFCYRAASEIGRLASALGGLDALVFTAGIGENSARVRAAICERSAWLGVDIDHAANNVNAARLNTPTSAVDVLVIPTNEEAVIAAATYQQITGQSDVSGRVE